MERGDLVGFERQPNIRCDFCGAPVPARRVDSLVSKLLGVRHVVDGREMLFCTEECFKIFKICKQRNEK